MKDLVLFATVLGVVGMCSAMRAFPTESVEMVERVFKDVNPRIVWDETNYLVDVSGRYAHCKYLNQDGSFQVDAKFQKDGQTIGGLRSTYPGQEAHWEAVNRYLADEMPTWKSDPRMRPQIERATSFGCSVQPGCRTRGGGSRQVSIACVFSPAFYDGQAEQIVKPKALAFTPEQYVVAELVLGISWDRTNYLENLSGTETDCSMIGKNYFAFPVARGENENNKLQDPRNYVHIDGIFGSELNRGDTEEAMVEVLGRWAKGEGQKLKTYPGVQVGCSLIPDCMLGGQMYVVVSCLYSSS